MFDLKLFVCFARTGPVDAHLTVNATLYMFATCSICRAVAMLKIGTSARPLYALWQPVVYYFVGPRSSKFEIWHLVHAPELSNVYERPTRRYLEHAARSVCTTLAWRVVRIETCVWHLVVSSNLNSLDVYKRPTICKYACLRRGPRSPQPVDSKKWH